MDTCFCLLSESQFLHLDSEDSHSSGTQLWSKQTYFCYPRSKIQRQKKSLTAMVSLHMGWPDILEEVEWMLELTVDRVMGTWGH